MQRQRIKWSLCDYTWKGRGSEQNHWNTSCFWYKINTWGQGRRCSGRELVSFFRLLLINTSHLILPLPKTRRVKIEPSTQHTSQRFPFNPCWMVRANHHQNKISAEQQEKNCEPTTAAKQTWFSRKTIGRETQLRPDNCHIVIWWACNMIMNIILFLSFYSCLVKKLS